MDLPGDLHLTVRRPSIDEAEAITSLLNTVDEHDYGVGEYSVGEVRDELDGIDLERDAWAVDGPDGQLIAFADLNRQGAGIRWEGATAVLPKWRGRGIGSVLAREVEQRAREHVPEAPEGVEVVLRGWVKAQSPARRWAEELGYRATREFLRMEMTMSEEPPQPTQVPDGVAIREFVKGRDERATFDALEEAFSDHWGHVPATFEEWVTRTKASTFDASLWLLARKAGEDEGEILATCLGSVGPAGGWITGVGTRRAWRARGISTALLREILRRFWERGVRTVALGVDGESLTGATRVYERLGMRVTDRHDQMTKVLREGRDVATRELTGRSAAQWGVIG
jgi:mycothiol synthase